MGWAFVAPEISIGVTGDLRGRAPAVVSLRFAFRPTVVGTALGARAAFSAEPAYDPAPEVGLVQAWAAECAGASPVDGARWIAQARRAALLPELAVSVDLGDDWDRSWDYEALDGIVDTAADADKMFAVASDVDRGADRGWSARATWHLDELLASPALVRAATLARTQVERREEAVKDTTSAYFDRRRRLASLALAPPKEPLERIKAEIAVDELTATLDALTCGRFGSSLR